MIITKKDQKFGISAQIILVILETEFNNNNGNISGYTSTNGQVLGTIVKEKFACKARSAIYESIAERCTMNPHQSQRQCFATTSCDLESYYDRILHNTTCLDLLHIGVSHSRIKSIFSAIQKINYRIRTSFGESYLVYGG